MKTAFLKNLFNTKDMGLKNNFNIHSVDLDDSDEVIADEEEFFQRNNSQNMKDIFKNKFIKSNETINDKQTNSFSLNDSILSCEDKSPMLKKKFDLAKVRQSPVRFQFFDNEKHMKNNLEFMPPTSMSNVVKTPKREEKMIQFQSLKSKGLNSPSMKVLNYNVLPESNKNFGIKSPMITKAFMSPSVTRINNTESDDCHGHSKIPMFYKKDYIEKDVNEIHNKMSTFNKIDYIEKDGYHSQGKKHIRYKNDAIEKSFNTIEKKDSKDKPNKEIEMCEMINKRDTSNRIQPESFEDINGYLSDQKSEESLGSNHDIEDNKLKVLHMKLKLESDKIQKWKVDIEKELSLKTKKISESDKIIESLRSSNLDLQMRQETISLNYREEIECRSEVSKKIENSRQLCHILKEKISVLEDVNKKYEKESENMKLIQQQVLHLLDFVTTDIKEFSQIQVQSLTDLKSKVTFKESEIETMQLNLSEQNKLSKIEVEKYEATINSFENELLSKKEVISNLNIEKDDIIAKKAECEILFESERNTNESLLAEKRNLIEEFDHLKISYKNLEHDNMSALKENESKQILINQLNDIITDLKLEYTQYNKEVSDRNTVAEISLKDKEDLINNLTSKIGILEQQIETNNESMTLLNEDMNIKITCRDRSIDDLTKSLLEKEDQISLLNETILKANNEIKDITESFDDLKLDKDSIVKNASILKSSNQDLREELNNYKSEINEQTEEIVSLKKQINYLKSCDDEHKVEVQNFRKSIIVLEEENTSQKSEISDIRTKLNNLNEANDQLKASVVALNDTNQFVLEEKLDEIKELTNKYNDLTLIRQTLDIETDLKSKEFEDMARELNFERLKMSNLIEKYEQLRISMESKDDELTFTINEKNQLKYINSNLTKDNDESAKIIKSYETVIIENKSKISSLETFVEDLSKDKQNILKSREDLRKELMFTLEQCKNENDVIEKKRNKEIENLKVQINSLTTNSTKNTKNSKNKISDLQNLISQQKEEIEELQKQKILISKSVEVSNLSMRELTDKILLKDQLLEENVSERQNLKSIIFDCESKIKVLCNDLSIKNNEISKFKEIELKYYEFKNNILTNSPPISAQVPPFITTCASATPKAQRLSSRLLSINSGTLDGQMLVSEKQTPQKTPKGILRQPGSASKRRRVLFEDSGIIEASLENGDDSSNLSDGVDIDLENIGVKAHRFKEDRSPISAIPATTPKKTNSVTKLSLTDARSTGRLNNIRKTPSKAPMKLNEKRKKDDKNWFDSDNFFGVNEP